MRRDEEKNIAVRKDCIIEVRLARFQSPEKLNELRQNIFELTQDKKCDVLVDVGPTMIGDGSTRPTAEKFFKGLPIRRFAIFGGSPPINLGIKTLIEEHANTKSVRIFRRESDARAWLLEN